MWEAWFSWWTGTEDGSKVRNPRGVISLPKSRLIEMLKTAFDAGVSMESRRSEAGR